VDAESELFDPPGYGEGKVPERDVWIGIPPETGGVRGRSSLGGGEGRYRAGELWEWSHDRASATIFRRGAWVRIRERHPSSTF